MTFNPSNLDYRSHLLLGQKHMSEAIVLARWEYAPSEKEVAEKIGSTPKQYTSFVLVNPCGPVLPGNFEHNYEM